MANEYTLGGPPPQSRSEKILMKQNPGPAQSRIEELLKNISGRTSGALIYKGTVETAMSLPSSGNEAGDVYHVNSDGSEWAWNGEQWEELGKSSSVLYTEQTLTPAQQEQARTNVGAGTYSKPVGGIPASDLASGVIPFVIPIVETSSGWELDPKSTLTATDIYNGIKQRDGTGSVQIAVVDGLSANYYSVSYFTFYEEGTEDPANTVYVEFSLDIEYQNGKYIDRIVAVQAQPWEDPESQLMIDEMSKAIGTSLPAVTASDNGKFLRVVSGAWAAETVSTWQGGSY